MTKFDVSQTIRIPNEAVVRTSPVIQLAMTNVLRASHGGVQYAIYVSPTICTVVFELAPPSST